VPRKRHYDLREFWPWYERNWLTRWPSWRSRSATPPPFTLSDIGQKDPVTPAEKRVAHLVFVLLIALAMGLVVWGLFFV
jgi:hypothetical protein